MSQKNLQFMDVGFVAGYLRLHLKICSYITPTLSAPQRSIYYFTFATNGTTVL